jgi:chemotaxis protein histidine kinase CheA
MGCCSSKDAIEEVTDSPQLVAVVGDSDVPNPLAETAQDRTREVDDQEEEGEISDDDMGEMEESGGEEGAGEEGGGEDVGKGAERQTQSRDAIDEVGELETSKEKGAAAAAAKQAEEEEGAAAAAAVKHAEEEAAAAAAKQVEEEAAAAAAAAKQADEEAAAAAAAKQVEEEAAAAVAKQAVEEAAAAAAAKQEQEQEEEQARKQAEEQSSKDEAQKAVEEEGAVTPQEAEQQKADTRAAALMDRLNVTFSEVEQWRVDTHTMFAVLADDPEMILFISYVLDDLEWHDGEVVGWSDGSGATDAPNHRPGFVLVEFDGEREIWVELNWLRFVEAKTERTMLVCPPGHEEGRWWTDEPSLKAHKPVGLASEGGEGGEGDEGGEGSTAPQEAEQEAKQEAGQESERKAADAQPASLVAPQTLLGLKKTKAPALRGLNSLGASSKTAAKERTEPEHRALQMIPRARAHAQGGTDLVFLIHRSNNTNCVCYKGDPTKGVKVLWIMFEKKGEPTEGLTFAERNTAYGYTCKPSETKSEEWGLKMKALSDREIIVSCTNGTWVARTQIGDERNAVLRAVHVEMKDSFIPAVKHIEIFGADGAYELKLP